MMMSLSRRKKRKSLTQKLIALIPVVVIGAIVWIALSNFSEKKSADRVKVDGDLLYVSTPKQIDEEIIDYKAMRVSYNKSTHNPNWVAWELTGDKAYGQEGRAKNFSLDPDVEGCASPDDYKHSGFDRGHMAPAGDMKWDKQAMLESFYMTNICPQAKELNTGSWKKLEDRCRDWAVVDSALYIVCGPVPGDKVDMRIGYTGVDVPKRFFKVIIAPYAIPPRGIGFIMPNGKVPGGMQQAAVSIDEVERITGYDFFSSLPDDVENKLESQCNFNHWAHIRP